MVPVWLLDIDGVINADNPMWHEKPHHGHVRGFNGFEFRFRWAPSLVQRIRELHTSGAVELRWCTTWVDEIEGPERAFQIFGAPTSFTFVNAAARLTTQELKMGAALAVAEERRPLIWTDDDAIPDEWVRVFEHDPLSLLIRPDVRHGLTPEDMDEIEAFARRFQ